MDVAGVVTAGAAVAAPPLAPEAVPAALPGVVATAAPLPAPADDVIGVVAVADGLRLPAEEIPAPPAPEPVSARVAASPMPLPVLRVTPLVVLDEPLVPAPVPLPDVEVVPPDVAVPAVAFDLLVLEPLCRSSSSSAASTVRGRAAEIAAVMMVGMMRFIFCNIVL